MRVLTIGEGSDLFTRDEGAILISTLIESSSYFVTEFEDDWIKRWTSSRAVLAIELRREVQEGFEGD